MRLPWLRARLRLLALAGWDLLVLLAAYGGMYQLRLGRWWGRGRRRRG